MPWSLNLAYSLTYNNSFGQNDFSTNSLMISSNISNLKRKVKVSTGYDFKQKGFTYTQFRFDRDLDSWRLDFSWVPFSDRALNFFIGIKSGLLSDLKYEKRSEPDRNSIDMKKIINTLYSPQPIGPYNQAILKNNTLFISGQIALDPKTMKLINDSIKEETIQVMENLKIFYQRQK